MSVLSDDIVELPGGAMMRGGARLRGARLGGLEFAIGVPAPAAPRCGQCRRLRTEIKDVLVDCDALAPDGSQHTHAAADLGFAYRDSRFKHDLTGHVMVAARLRVRADLAVVVRALTDAIQTSAGRPSRIASGVWVACSPTLRATTPAG